VSDIEWTTKAVAPSVEPSAQAGHITDVMAILAQLTAGETGQGIGWKDRLSPVGEQESRMGLARISTNGAYHPWVSRNREMFIFMPISCWWSALGRAENVMNIPVDHHATTHTAFL